MQLPVKVLVKYLTTLPASYGGWQGVQVLDNQVFYMTPEEAARLKSSVIGHERMAVEFLPLALDNADVVIDTIERASRKPARYLPKMPGDET